METDTKILAIKTVKLNYFLLPPILISFSKAHEIKSLDLCSVMSV